MTISRRQIHSVKPTLRRMARAICATAIFATAPAWTAELPAKVTFNDHVLPLFRNACNNCHNPDKKKAGLDLTTYQAAMSGSENGPVVRPGDGGNSGIFKVCAPGGDPRMPPKGDQLNENELALLKKWIEGFALESATSKPAAAQKNNVEVAVVSLTRPDGPPPMPGDMPLEPFTRPEAKNTVLALAASPWAPLVAVGGQKQVTLYHTDRLEPLGIIPFNDGLPTVVKFSRNGQLLLVGGGQGGKSGRVSLWNVITGERAGAVGAEQDTVLAADLTPDHQFVALGGPNKLLKIYATADGKLVHSLKKHTDWLTAVSFSPDGKYLATGDRSGGIIVWEGATGKEFNVIPGHKAMVTALAFMPNILASASEDGTVVIWDVREPKEVKKITGAHAGGALWVDFTPDGRLVTCGRDKQVRVWDIAGKKIVEIAEPFAEMATRCAIAGERIIAGDWTGRIRVFGLDGKPLGDLATNPPGLNEQFGIAKKALTESDAALPGLLAAVTAAEAKVKAERDAAQAAKLAAVSSAEKKLADAQAAETSLAASVKQLQDHAAKLATDLAAIVAKRSELKAAAAKAEEGTDAAAKAAAAKAVADNTPIRDKAKADSEAAAEKAEQAKNALPEKQNVAKKAIAEAQTALAKAKAALDTTGPAKAAAQAAADLEKKLDRLNNSIAEARKVRDALTAGSPEYEAANVKVQALKPEIATAEEELAKAQSGSAKPAPTAAEAELTKATDALKAAQAQNDSAKAILSRFERAREYMAVYQARNTFDTKNARFEETKATAKEAFRQVEQIKSTIEAARKTAADAPAKIKAAQAEIAKLTAAKTAADQAVVAADAALAAADAKAKAASADFDKLTAEQTALNKQAAAIEKKLAAARAKRDPLVASLEAADKTVADKEAAKAPAPEIEAAKKAAAAALAKRNAAQEPVEAAKKEAADVAAKLAELEPKIAPLKPAAEAAKAELPKLQQAVTAAKEAAKLAGIALVPAEKILNDAKAAAAAATKQIADLGKRLPDLERDAAKTKSAAEKESATLAGEVQKLKAEADRLRADFSKRWSAKTAAN